MKIILQRALTISLTLLIGFSINASHGLAQSDNQDRPNILLIITDDQRFDTMDFMPSTYERIFEQGAEFTRAYVTTPLCCPSRASILTGQYAHTHHVVDNRIKLENDIFVTDFHEAGYYTGIVGKYLNSWAVDLSPDVPHPAFDVWFAHGSLIQTDYYTDPLFNIDGEWTEFDEYTTFVVRDRALAFLQDAGETDDPFLLIFSPFAPHYPAIPAPGDETLYSDLPMHRPPNFNPGSMSSVNRFVGSLSLLTQSEIEAIDELRLNQLRTLHSLDQSINVLLDYLEETGELDNTVVIYLSDNGIAWGEHRLAGEKTVLYEETVHVPFGMRYPALIPDHREIEGLVGNIDIVPTLYDLANLAASEDFDGRSLIPLIQGDEEWREGILLETWPTQETTSIGFQTEEYLYIETLTTVDRGLYFPWFDITFYAIDRQIELYDLVQDPYQLSNIAGSPEVRSVEGQLRRQLRAQDTLDPYYFKGRPNLSAGDIGVLAFAVTLFILPFAMLVYVMLRTRRNRSGR